MFINLSKKQYVNIVNTNTDSNKLQTQPPPSMILRDLCKEKKTIRKLSSNSILNKNKQKTLVLFTRGLSLIGKNYSYHFESLLGKSFGKGKFCPYSTLRSKKIVIFLIK